MNTNFTRQELNELETMERTWDGHELKIDHENLRVWLTNKPDYVVQTKLSNGEWKQEYKYFS